MNPVRSIDCRHRTACLMLAVALTGLALAWSSSACAQTAPPAPNPGGQSNPRAQQPAAPAIIPPPFLPDAGAQPTRRTATPGAMPAPYITGARQFLVQPGQTWQHLLEEIQPGDEIIFPAGFHVPQVIAGLQGTAERPIFLRSRDPVPAAVACETDGWIFVRPRHVIVENILFLNPHGAAVVVDGTGDSAASALFEAQFTMRNCTVTCTRKDPEQDAVRIRNVSDVRVDQVRVDGWNDAAVEITDARRVLVRGLLMAPSTQMKQAVGVKVEGSSGQVSITGCSFNKVVRTGVRVGTPCPGGDCGAARPVEQVRIDRCLFEDPGQLLEIVNARDLVLSRATVINPTAAIYSIPADAGTVEQVLVERCLAFWFPGTLAKFSPHPDRIPPTAVTLAENLWYSLELPTAWEALGAPFGYQAMPQHISPDPGMDITTLRPRNGEAIRYGAYSMAAPTSARPSDNPVDGPELPPVRKPEAPPPASRGRGTTPDAPAAPKSSP